MARKQVKKQTTFQKSWQGRKNKFLAWLGEPRNLLIFIVAAVLVLVAGTFLFNRTVGYFQKQAVENRYDQMKLVMIDRASTEFEVDNVEEQERCRYTSRKFEKGELYCSKSIAFNIVSEDGEFNKTLATVEKVFQFDFTAEAEKKLLNGRRDNLSISSPSIHDECGFSLYYANDKGFSLRGTCSEVNPRYEFFPVEK